MFGKVPSVAKKNWYSRFETQCSGLEIKYLRTNQYDNDKWQSI